MICPDHLELLTAAAISEAVADAAGVRSACEIDDVPEHARWVGAPGLVFPWHPASGGEAVEQYRPDNPPIDDEGRARKYLWPKGVGTVLTVHPAMRDRVGGPGRLVLVEGTKQHLAAVTAAMAGADAIIGMAGCWGWKTPDLDAVSFMGREVVVILDADISTKPQVWAAAKAFRDWLRNRCGAKRVAFVRLVGDDNKAGLDDILADAAEPAQLFAILVQNASARLPARPAGESEGNPFTEGGLKAKALVDALRARDHYALDLADVVMVYQDGHYVPAGLDLRQRVADFLCDDYRPQHEKTVGDMLAAELHRDRLRIPETLNDDLINVTNGLLEISTGRLRPHSPERMSVVQFAVRWDPQATCPTFDKWLVDVIGDRADDLLEAASLLFDRTGRQRRSLFLYGPTRSGKGTFIRLLAALVGPEHTTAVTLHQLGTDPFAAADLRGSVLNAAADLAAHHVDDLSLFKQLTGDDLTRGQRKFGQPFHFKNQALFVFSANEIPTVGEVSKAFLARIRSYEFGRSFLGAEDPAVEAEMLRELPGIMVRLVDALRRFRERGGYLEDAASIEAEDMFARHSDRVRLFLHECTTPDGAGWVTRSGLNAAFSRWAEISQRASMGAHRLYESVQVAGYRLAKRGGVYGFVGLTLRPELDWGPPLSEPKFSDRTAPSAPYGADEGAEGAGRPLLFEDFERCTTKEKDEHTSDIADNGAETAPSAPSFFEQEF